MKQISKTKAKNMIKKSNGAFFSVRFIKKNKETRYMVCRLGVTKFLKGGKLAYKPEDKGLMVVFDATKRDYRMINLKTLSKLRIDGQSYKVV
jgi:hypothetical protein